MKIRDVCFLTQKLKMSFFRIFEILPMKNKENSISAKIAKVASNKSFLFTYRIL